MDDQAPKRPRRVLRVVVSTGLGLIGLAILVMWTVEVLDTVLLDDRLQRHGINPRRVEGLDGVFWAPFLHSDFAHLGSNTVPLLVLGGLISVRGFRYWSITTALIVVGGGLATWLLAGGVNHVGASGVIFGYFGALLGAAWFERRRAALGGALLAIFLYSGMVAGLVPQPELSWEGHLFGLLAGVVAARILAEKPAPHDPDDPGDVQPWEIDEPWLQ